MKQFETVVRCGRTYVVVNGVESPEFATPNFDGYAVYQPEYLLECKTRKTALEIIAHGMDDWYTVPEAAARLVKLGKADRPPSLKTMYRWIHARRLPGAVKVEAVGYGGAWRIPEGALREFKRKGGRKR